LKGVAAYLSNGNIFEPEIEVKEFFQW